MPAQRRIHALSVLALLVSWGTAASAENDTPSFSAESIEFFEREVRPLLVEQCQKCHGPHAQKGKLRIDSRAALLIGGDTGPAVVPGKPEESLLIDAVSYGDLYQMPPSGKLADKQIAVFRRWVEQGAPWPGDLAAISPGGQPSTARPAFDLTERAKHWAFQPLDKQAPPAVSDQTWPRSEIDHYILARMEAAGLSPASAAEKQTLLRRAAFDLLGLPPTPGEMTSFLADDRPDAFSRVVDRLLASPHFGERWARHWLDLVRYAESKGHEFDYTIPNAWQYRDYVIRALNADVPYNQFVVEHIAGDLMEPPRRHPEQGFNESVLGTGFWFLGEEVHSPIELQADELDRTDNKIDVFSKTFLALTVACARCHDHKFDAISTKDYYALAGYLLSSSYRQVPFDALDTERTIAERLAASRAERRPALLAATHAALRPALERMSELLLGSRDVLQSASLSNAAATAGAATGSPTRKRGESLPDARDQAIAKLSNERGLAADELSRWVEVTREALADSASPLHLWAVAAAARLDQRSTPAASVKAALNLMQPPKTEDSNDTVFDFGKVSPQDWREDGFVFGRRPMKVGAVSFSENPQRTLTRVWSVPAAVSDPFWDAAALAPGVEREGGRFSWLQSGRMLRTPTFHLRNGKLFYLVSGSGYAYAVVHSHRMNNGPLHGALIHQWQAGEGFQWIEHDLSVYHGQRVHIEFSPRQPDGVEAGASPVLAVARIVEAEHVPHDVGSQALSALSFSDAELATWQSLSAAYEQRFTHAAEQLAADSLASPGEAALADWLLRKLDLFASPASEARNTLAAAAAPYAAAQAELTKCLPKAMHTAPALFDGNGVNEHVMLRGNYKTPGEIVPRHYLEALGGLTHTAPADGSGRLDLARQMVDPAQPLVARVIVNRVWQHLFGRGLVASVDNFGVLGEAPSHRELLDKLAGDFVADGWSLKRLIRRLLLTSAYQLSSQPSELARRLDPDNLLLSHARVKRLEAEAIRDNLLAVSGRLDHCMYGPSVPTFVSEFMEGRGRPASGPLDGDGRRSIYLSVRRNFLSTFFMAFDYPVPFTSVGRRTVSNVPAQALTMMNSPFVAGEARRWAEPIQREALDARLRIERLYMTAFGRPPTATEAADAINFLAQQSQAHDKSHDPRAWADLCHVLLNSKEFVFIE